MTRTAPIMLRQPKPESVPAAMLLLALFVGGAVVAVSVAIGKRLRPCGMGLMRLTRLGRSHSVKSNDDEEGLEVPKHSDL